MTEELPVNIINLITRPERKEQAEKQAEEQGFYARFFEGIVHRHDRKRGICEAHKQVVRDAKECGYKYTIIAEDDILFTAKGGWDYFLSRIDAVGHFDLLFSMIYVGAINEENRIEGLFSGMTMYCVPQHFYDFLLNLPDSCHIDRELGLTSHIHRYLVCDKFVCYQDGSRSDNNFMTCDYSPYLEGRKIFGKD